MQKLALIRGVASVASKAAFLGGEGGHSWRKCTRSKCDQCTPAQKLERTSKLIADMFLSADDRHTKRGTAIANCSNEWGVLLAKSGARPIPVSHCRQRMCPKCQSIRGQKWWEIVERVLESRKKNSDCRPPKLVTLTQRDKKGETLAEAKDRFNAAWTRFRQSAEFRRRVRGALFCREVTWSGGKNGHWHFHAHALFDCEYWPVEELRALWESRSGGHQVWITECTEDSIKEAVKYPLKMMRINDRRVLCDGIDGLHGARMISSLGEWRDMISDEDLEPQDEAPDIASWEKVLTAFHRNEAWSIAAIAQLSEWFREHGGPQAEFYLAAAIMARRKRLFVRGLGHVFDVIPGAHAFEDRWIKTGDLPYRLRQVS